MNNMILQRLSIDLSNRCSKQCDFCYNSSNRNGAVMWKPNEIIDLVKDCSKNGLQAVSFGGGEPFEYESIFEIISTLSPLVFVSVTTNGIPLKNSKIWSNLVQNKPNKIHITIHDPKNRNDINRALLLIQQLKRENIRTGINLLVSADKIKEAKQLFRELEELGISRKEIILIPRKFNLQPTPKEIAEVTNNEPFQSTSCLTQCKKSERFASISWDKKINFCSYSPSKVALQEFSHKGVADALNSIIFETCQELNTNKFHVNR